MLNFQYFYSQASFMQKVLVLLILVALCSGFIGIIQSSKDLIPIPPSKQRSGDAAAGFKYLTEGNYIKGGIPYDIYIKVTGKGKKTLLIRDSLNADVAHDYTVVKAVNGENLVAPNCLQCHAQVFEGKLVIGMGNSMADFTLGRNLSPQAYSILENTLRRNSPSQYEASKPFIDVAKTIGPYLTTQVRGVNPADRLAAVLAAHRDPETFTWKPEASLEIPEEVIPSDVPAWWLLKKKNAMFYNGFGRGDFGRFLMASNLLTVNDTAESREVDNRMGDVLAYINSIEAPKYPRTIDSKLAAKGKQLYIRNCSKCHGSYGAKSEYPNLLVPAEVIQTDSALFKSNYQNPQFIEWFNNSWFAKGDHPARLVPFNGYIAPPLDGVWSTAPYLHNGSVPTIEAVLNSKLRPVFWEREFNNPEYDYDKLGWKFTTPAGKQGSTVYNTTLRGYGSQGHYFGDKLSDAERKAIIEYLKGL
jgi:mono/diheme cytochrome c family protein